MHRIALWAAVSAALAAGLGSPASLYAQATASGSDEPHWSATAKDYRLHMIGNAHVDAPWLWPLVESDAVVHSTFRSALERMKEDPGLTMTTSSSQFYEWVEASDPGMIAEIRKRVQEGRWNLVGGWWVEPDVNMPSGEALIRQGLYGQRTLERIFGRTARVGYNPDSFGHPGNLPQILRLQGLNDYVFMRPNAAEKPGVTQNLFIWQGVDGSRTLTFRIPVSYGSGGSARPHMEQELAQLAGQPEKTAMDFFGVGDHGGGPTKESMASIRKMENEPGAPTIFYSTPERFFDEVSPHLPADIQVVTGDLQHHSVGCYTAGSEIKKMNRSTEAALVTAEKLSAIGSVAWGAEYPKAEFTKAWQRLLLLQFHDSLAGTTLPSYFVAARDAFGRARDVARETLYEAAQRLAWQIPTTDPGSTYLVVFNPHAWPVKTNVEYDLFWNKKDYARAEDEQGNSLPVQWVEPNTHFSTRNGLVAQVEVPALGYRQIRLHMVASAEPPPAATVHAQGETMENDHLRVTFSAGGTLSLFDKDTGTEVFRKGATGGAALVMDDPSDTWSHNVRAYDKEVGAFARQELKVEEEGPVRARIRERSTYGASTLVIDWILYAGSRKLEARVSLDWHEHLKMLKFSFPVDVSAPQATYEIGYGAIERDTKGDEDPGQRWIDVTGTGDGKPYGLAILNDAKYGYSIDGTDMRVSVARAAVYAEHMPYKLLPGVDYQWQDQGLQSFTMELMPHTGSWQDAGVVHAAEELVAEIPVVYQGIHPGTRPQSASFLSVDAPNVVVEAVKQAEDNGDIVIRSYETAGRPTTAHLHLAFANATWTGAYHPFEIKTIRLNPRTGAVAEVNALER